MSSRSRNRPWLVITDWNRFCEDDAPKLRSSWIRPRVGVLSWHSNSSMWAFLSWRSTSLYLCVHVYIYSIYITAYIYIHIYIHIHIDTFKKITSQNVWPRLNSSELIQTAQSAVSKFTRSVYCFLRREPRNFEIVTLVHAGESISGGFWPWFWLLNSLQGGEKYLWRGVLVHKNPVASCQRCRLSVESHALTCPYKQSDLSACSLLSWHPTDKYDWGRLCFVPNCCFLSTVTVTPVETQIMSTEALLSRTVSVKIHTKAHVYDFAFRRVRAHPAAAVRNCWRR